MVTWRGITREREKENQQGRLIQIAVLPLEEEENLNKWRLRMFLFFSSVRGGDRKEPFQPVKWNWFFKPRDFAFLSLIRNVSRETQMKHNRGTVFQVALPGILSEEN